MLKNVIEFNGHKAGDTVTFAHELISIGGQILHKVGDKATIRDFSITPGHYYRPLPDIWIDNKLNTIQLVEEKGVSFMPDAFLEFKE